MKLFATYFVLMMQLGLQSVVADNWQFDKVLKSDDFTFGNTTITRIIDTRENQTHPIYKTKVTINGEDVALIKNLTFNTITRFDNGNYFLGVSNSGLSAFAFFILDATGNLLRAENHSDNIHYCKQSVTLVRQWVDEQNLDIMEHYSTQKNSADSDNPQAQLKRVTIKGCDGKRLQVWPG